MKIFFNLIFLSLQFFNPIVCINSTLECSSTNDPHMINFNKVAFEFHYGGTFPLYESSYVKIYAGFKRCSPTSNAYCNCLIEVELYNGEFVIVNNCFGLDSEVQTDENNLDCSTQIQISSLFSEAAWEEAPDVHQSFKCATTPTNSIVVRTTLPSRKNDVMILIYKRPDIIDQIKIYPSDNYAFNSLQETDKSLCGSYDRADVPKIETNKIQIDEKIVSKCDEELVDNCIEKAILSPKQSFMTTRVKKLVQDCALDIKVGVESTGMFQKEIFEQTIYEELVKNYRNPQCKSDICLDSEVYNMLRKFCTCKGKVPNKMCLIEKKCTKSFKLCV
ncbi:unnamed protein product [Brachionus calyciflorus]|uniref:Uncharacterized protein n=1 Tax=Brachionus calyciflorus TaxID=104777 RepID=A0A813TIA6_9BILA|nr:unnamed protein product [Brachionus calyciflorus]